MYLFQKLHSITKKFFAEVLLDDLERGKIDLKNLPLLMRRCVISCSILLSLIIISTIILYFYDNLLPGITFPYYDTTYTISYLALFISVIAFILGWTFLLMGGIWSNTTTFAILSCLCFYFIGFLGLGQTKTWWTLLPLGFITILLILSLEYSRQALRNIDAPLGALALCYIVSFFALRSTTLSLLIPVRYWWWIIGGLTLLLICITWLLSSLVRQRFPEERFVNIGRLITIGIILIFLTVIIKQEFKLDKFSERLFVVFDSIRSYISLFWFVLGFCALWMVTNLAEWTRDALQILSSRIKSQILVLLQLIIFVLLFINAYHAIQQELIETQEFQLLPLAIFIITITWLLFQGGGLIVNRSSRWFPRHARLFLFFGIILIMAGMNNIMLITKIRLFINEFRLSAYRGFLYIGPPFIIYLWLVKRLKHHPVRPSELASLFIWGAVLVHLSIGIEKIIQPYKIQPYLLVILMAITQEYIKLFVIKKLVYNSKHFNELIDGIIYSSCISLGWAIFYINPQFGLTIYPLRFPQEWSTTVSPLISTNAAFLWFYFTLQFVCAGLVGYGLAKGKLSGVPYNKISYPLILGLFLAVLYRTGSDIIFKNNINKLFFYGTIWPYTGFSLLIIGIIIAKALGIYKKRYIKFPIIACISLILCTGWQLYQWRTVSYRKKQPYFQFVVPRSWKSGETAFILEEHRKDKPIKLIVSLTDIPEGIEKYESKGKITNFHGIEMTYYLFSSSLILPLGEKIEFYNKLLYIFSYKNTVYSFLFSSRDITANLGNIDRVIQSFCFEEGN